MHDPAPSLAVAIVQQLYRQSKPERYKHGGAVRFLRSPCRAKRPLTCRPVATVRLATRSAAAPSSSSRTLAGATPGALGLLGAVLGTAVYLAAVAFFWAQLPQSMSQVPVLDLLLILVGMPVAATAGGRIFAGREPPAIGRRPLE